MTEYGAPSKLIRMRARGQVTIPLELREALKMNEATGLNILRVGRALVMTPRRLERVSLAREMEKELKKEGLTLEDLLKDLRKQRER
jgi:bifunctional DNA-binding transcriptional regulator/antitoxin component of YhaV-PrlF toxin-antitoxin module